ncbi:unnamed protein product [Leuciscus chuanchicus]
MGRSTKMRGGGFSTGDCTDAVTPVVSKQPEFDTVSVALQVYIRILDNEWNVYRRYTEFRTLHSYLRPQFPQVDTFNFPPKKAIGNKGQVIGLWHSFLSLPVIFESVPGRATGPRVALQRKTF